MLTRPRALQDSPAHRRPFFPRHPRAGHPARSASSRRERGLVDGADDAHDEGGRREDDEWGEVQEGDGTC
jgi:hypothetical protein